MGLDTSPLFESRTRRRLPPLLTGLQQHQQHVASSNDYTGNMQGPTVPYTRGFTVIIPWAYVFHQTSKPRLPSVTLALYKCTNRSAH